MRLPTPDDPAYAPVWDNYIVAQTTAASLGTIPQDAIAVGVEVAGTDVTLRFQLTELTEDDEDDMDDIVSELEGLVGNHVHVERSYEIRDRCLISPHDGIRWIFLARQDP